MNDQTRPILVLRCGVPMKAVPLTKKDIAQITRDYKRIGGILDAAQVYDVCSTTFFHMLKALNIKTNPRGAKKGARWSKKTSAKDRKEMVRLNKEGATISELGRRYGVSYQCVQQIVKGGRYE